MRKISAQQRRALTLLASSSDGSTEPMLLVHGIAIETMVEWSWSRPGPRPHAASA
jgi:hypothetical protein